jgi:methylisocitrate lyase
VLENVRRIAAAVRIPVIADVDDGGATAIHIRRTIELAERSGAAGVMIEDVDSARPKHLWNDAKGDWELSESVLYPVDTAVERLGIAIDARHDPSFVIMARTDAFHTDPERGLTIALERAREYAAAGADSLFVLGLPGDELSEDLVESLGAPLLYADVAAVSAEERSRVFATGASLFHGLLPLVAAFSAFKETLESLKAGTPPAFDRDPWAVNRELLETLDLRGWTRYLRAN